MARKRYPGKFEACDDDRLADVLSGLDCDEECGSVDELGWYGLILHRNHGYIVEEDSNGFFTYTFYEMRGMAQSEYDNISSSIAEEYESQDESNGGAF